MKVAELIGVFCNGDGTRSAISAAVRGRRMEVIRAVQPGELLADLLADRRLQERI